MKITRFSRSLYKMIDFFSSIAAYNLSLGINILSFKRYIPIKISYANVTFSPIATHSQVLLPRLQNVIILLCFIYYRFISRFNPRKVSFAIG